MKEKCVDVIPDEPGEYCIVIRGVHTLVPIFATFDGADWDWASIDKRLNSWGLGREEVYWFPDE